MARAGAMKIDFIFFGESHLWQKSIYMARAGATEVDFKNAEYAMHHDMKIKVQWIMMHNDVVHHHMKIKVQCIRWQILGSRSAESYRDFLWSQYFVIILEKGAGIFDEPELIEEPEFLMSRESLRIWKFLNELELIKEPEFWMNRNLIVEPRFSNKPELMKGAVIFQWTGIFPMNRNSWREPEFYQWTQ